MANRLKKCLKPFLGKRSRRVRDYKPWFTFGISIIQIIIFYITDTFYMLERFGYDAEQPQQMYRFLSMVFVHKDAAQLWNNIAMQIILGFVLEKFHGWYRIGPIYFASAFGGGLCAAAIGYREYEAGASGALMGLFFTLAADFLLNWGQLRKTRYRVYSILTFIIHSILLAFCRDDSSESTVRLAHMGGAFIGLFISNFIIHQGKFDESGGQFQFISAFILVALILTLILISLGTGPKGDPEEWYDFENLRKH